jgi:hypothetical protein
MRADSSPVEPVTLSVSETVRVSGLLQRPAEAEACFVLAHGAGAGMNHPFLADTAAGLAARGIASLRYQFPYFERGSKRPDPPALCHATVRAAVAEISRREPSLPLFAGGRSFGGRMTSQAQALSPLPGVKGLIFLAFPLHPAKSPSDDRAKHLFDVNVPMLFLQGTRDALAEMSMLGPLLERLGKLATTKLFQDADHSFHVPARSGRTDKQIKEELLDATAAWIKSLI